MPQNLIISSADIIHQMKLRCHIPDIVNAIASQRIISHTAAKYQIQVTEEELQQEGDNLRLVNKLVKAKDTWEWLKKNHMSLNDFEELVHNQVLSKKLANELFGNAVEKLFYDNQTLYTSAVTYEVLLEDRDLALELFYAVTEGEITFPEVVYQYTQEPEQRRTYGYQGLRHRQDFRPEIAAAIFAATPPQMIKPISTAKGVYLIWVEEIIQPQLNPQLYQQIISQSFSEWLQQQIQSYEISVQIQDENNPEAELEVSKLA
jgi:parvulin-like peptidyl-prolyl isomerase